MGKHTPGPWKVDKRERETLITAPTMPCIAAVSPSLHAQPGVGTANATLIAGAPELLHALKSADLLIGNQLSPEGRHRVLALIHSTIAKAEGVHE